MKGVQFVLSALVELATVTLEPAGDCSHEANSMPGAVLNPTIQTFQSKRTCQPIRSGRVH